MSLYDEGELQASIADGERKLAMKRQQKRHDQKRLLALGAILAFAIPLCVVSGIVAGRAPSAPSLIVTWPKPKVRQVLAPGQTILAREGQPFSVEVTGSENWQVTWSAAGIESGGGEFTWAPAEAKSELVARCKPITEGWQKFFAWTWPRRDVSLRAVAAQKVGDYGRALENGSEGAWVYPHVFAAGSARFDERALPLLASAIPLVPSSQLAENLAQVEPNPTPQLWQIVGDFEGNSDAPRAGSIDGTFASFYSPDLENALLPIAAHIVKTAPDASVKFVLRLDKDPKEGILRLAFDGKRERRAWVRREGETAGGPLTGWEEGEAKGNLLPSLPQ